MLNLISPKVCMIKIDKETEDKVFELLSKNRSQKEIQTRTGVTIGTIQEWAAKWRKQGKLVHFNREGMEGVLKAKSMSNGYYKSIRKRYASMKWTDKLEKREFGFTSPVEAIPYYLDSEGNPRVCAYCGRKPEDGKVWGLDRLNSSIGHVKGNLVPCCTTHEETRFLSCQTSKSSFTLKAWMEASMTRAYGKQLPQEVVLQRLEEIYTLAKDLGNIITN
jgi:transposase